MTMDFLNQVFPVANLFSREFGERFTAWYTFAIILYFIVSCIWFSARLGRVNRILEKSNKNLPGIESMADPVLRDSWVKYESTFLAKEGERRKTEADAIAFFDELTLLERVTNMRYWLAVPGLLVGFGILGTFLGLTTGVTGFDTSTTESIRISIEGLLEGMSTAFATSIWGMFLSAGFNIVEKIAVKRLAKKCYVHSQRLDEIFKLSKADLLHYFRQEQEKALINAFSVKIDGNRIEPGHMLRDLILESKEQTASLKSFSTDLADGITLSTETISQIGSGLGTTLHNSLATDFLPAIDKLEGAVEGLADVKEQSSGEFVERVVANLEASLEQMLSSVHNSLSGSTMSSLERLANIVADAGSSLNNLPEQVSHTMSNLQADVGAIYGSLETTAQQINAEALDAARMIRQGMHDAAGLFTQLSQSIQKEAEGLIEKQAKEALVISKLVNEFRELLQNNRNYTDSINDSLDNLSNTTILMNTLNEKMLLSAQLLEETGGLLEQNSKLFGEDLDRFVSGNKTTVQDLFVILEKSQEAAEHYASNFETIKKGLASIFQELEVGLSSYQTITRDSLNEYLGQFTQNLEAAVSGLAGSIEDLEALFEPLSELGSKMAQ